MVMSVFLLQPINAAGHRTQITESNGRTITHLFDKLYRLKSETIAGASSATNGSISYVLDQVGNRTSRTVAGSTALQALLPDQSFDYTANDWLSHHTQDENGNTTESPQEDADLITADGQAVIGNNADVYDFRNKLLQRSRADGVTINCAYNADGDRIWKEVKGSDGLITKFIRYTVDRNNHTGYGQVVEEMDFNGELVTRYHYGHDLVAVDRFTDPLVAPGRYYYSYDGHGSVRSITNDSGAIVEEYDYDAFGIMIALRTINQETAQFEERPVSEYYETSLNDYLYTGEQFDRDLGQYYLRARYLNPQSGRFHTMDTYEGRNGEPITLHKYLYANANPVSGTDPSGNMTLIEMARTVSLQVQITTISLVNSIGFKVFSGSLTAIAFLIDPEQFVAEARDDIAALGPLGFAAAISRVSLNRVVNLRSALPFFNKQLSRSKRFKEFQEAATILKKRFNYSSNNTTIAYGEFEGAGVFDDVVSASGAGKLGPLRPDPTLLNVVDGGAYHAEEKILQYYAVQFKKQNVNAGNLRIWVDRDPCNRCRDSSGVFGEFKKLFPAINLEIVSP